MNTPNEFLTSWAFKTANALLVNWFKCRNDAHETPLPPGYTIDGDYIVAPNGDRITTQQLHDVLQCALQAALDCVMKEHEQAVLAGNRADDPPNGLLNVRVLDLSGTDDLLPNKRGPEACPFFDAELLSMYQPNEFPVLHRGMPRENMQHCGPNERKYTVVAATEDGVTLGRKYPLGKFATGSRSPCGRLLEGAPLGSTCERCHPVCPLHPANR
jgi:hypothetical protein